MVIVEGIVGGGEVEVPVWVVHQLFPRLRRIRICWVVR